MPLMLYDTTERGHTGDRGVSAVLSGDGVAEGSGRRCSGECNDVLSSSVCVGIT